MRRIQTVRLVKDVSEVDNFNRLLRYVWVGDTFVNDWLIRNGYAYAATFPPDVRYAEQFVAAQQEAMQAGRGLWSECEGDPEPTATPTTPPPDPTATPTSTPVPTEPPADDCHPSYPDHCVPPPPPDLNCPDLPSSWKPIRVLHNVPNPDPHGFDNDQDGWGCESG